MGNGIPGPTPLKRQVSPSTLEQRVANQASSEVSGSEPASTGESSSQSAGSHRLASALETTRFTELDKAPPDAQNPELKVRKQLDGKKGKFMADLRKPKADVLNPSSTGTRAEAQGLLQHGAGSAPSAPAELKPIGESSAAALPGLTRPGDPGEVRTLEDADPFRNLHPIAQANFIEATRSASTSELRAEILKVASSPEFAALGESEQKVRANAIQEAIQNRQFSGIGAELQREVVRSAGAGRGNAAQLMKAAVFNPQAGRINLQPGSGADHDSFCQKMRRAMVRSPSFRKEMFDQNKDTKHPITMQLGHGQPRIFVDGSHMFMTPQQPGTHTVDLDDLQNWGTEPGQRPRPNATTQDQLLIHFMVEARREARTEMTDAKQVRNAFRQAHSAGLRAENKFRSEMGQAGKIISHHSSPSNPSELIFDYKGHSDERVRIDNHAQITSITY